MKRSALPLRLRGRFFYYAFSAAFTLGLSRCAEGPGGTAGITGIAIRQEFDLYGNLFREYPATDERIYLVFGEDSVIGEETRTHYNGRYRFDFLRKGNYRVYAYADCASCPGGSEVVEVLMELDKGGELAEAPVLYLRAE